MVSRYCAYTGSSNSCPSSPQACQSAKCTQALAGGRAESRGHQRGAARGVELEGHVDEPAGVVLGRRLHERAAAGRSEGSGETGGEGSGETGGEGGGERLRHLGKHCEFKTAAR
jgi:hypothetical protein